MNQAEMRMAHVMRSYVCMGCRLVEAVEARGGVVLPLAEGNKGERREGDEGALCVPVTTPDGDVLGALQVNRIYEDSNLQKL